jgi:hypothetical protein
MTVTGDPPEWQVGGILGRSVDVKLTSSAYDIPHRAAIDSGRRWQYYPAKRRAVVVAIDVRFGVNCYFPSR